MAFWIYGENKISKRVALFHSSFLLISYTTLNTIKFWLLKFTSLQKKTAHTYSKMLNVGLLMADSDQ
jgi:hypothetical protein